MISTAYRLAVAAAYAAFRNTLVTSRLAAEAATTEREARPGTLWVGLTRPRRWPLRGVAAPYGRYLFNPDTDV